MVGSMKKVVVVIAFFVLLASTFYYLQNLGSSTGDKTLRVYTYSSFTSEYGPAGDIKKLFKEQTGYDIEFISSDSALVMLEKFSRDKNKVDVFIGLDQFSIKKAKESVEWTSVQKSKDSNYFNVFYQESSSFVPYNWSPMTFIYKDSSLSSINNWQALVDSKVTYSVPDPRTSSPGNIYLYWLYSTFKDRFVIASHSLKPLSQWASSWTTAYGMFTNGNVQLGFSYLSSLAYHWNNNEMNYKALSFPSGHPIHVEYVGVPKNCNHCKIALQFVKFLRSKPAQTALMNKNYMFPVLKSAMKDTVFEKLPKLNLLPSGNMDSFINERNEIIDVWKKIHRNN